MLGARRYRLTELLDVREGQPMKSQFEACSRMSSVDGPRDARDKLTWWRWSGAVFCPAF